MDDQMATVPTKWEPWSDTAETQIRHLKSVFLYGKVLLKQSYFYYLLFPLKKKKA